jgi:hypothetical protein
MSWCRSIRLPILMCTGVLLTGAMNPQSSGPTCMTRIAAPSSDREDPEAAALVDAALRALDPQRVPWVQTQVWQRVHVPGLEYQSEGHYLTGPGHRFRLDLTIRVGGSTGQIQVINDGAICWQSEQFGSGARVVRKVDLQSVLDGLGNPGNAAQLRDELFQAQAFGGPQRLLASMHSQLRFTRKESVRWKGQPLIRLIGFATRGDDGSQAGAAFTPRQCRLYLHPQSLWPCRLEWWGPAQKCSRDTLLIQMEFRDPQLPGQVSDREFAFDPGKDWVEDRTPQLAEAVHSHAQ